MTPLETLRKHWPAEWRQLTNSGAYAKYIGGPDLPEVILFPHSAVPTIKVDACGPDRAISVSHPSLGTAIESAAAAWRVMRGECPNPLAAVAEKMQGGRHVTTWEAGGKRMTVTIEVEECES